MLKLIFRATVLQERPKFDIFPKALFSTLASSANCSRTVFMKSFYFFLLKNDFFFKFTNNIGRNNSRLSKILARFSFTISEVELRLQT